MVAHLEVFRVVIVLLNQSPLLLCGMLEYLVVIDREPVDSAAIADAIN